MPPHRGSFSQPEKCLHENTHTVLSMSLTTACGKCGEAVPSPCPLPRPRSPETPVLPCLLGVGSPRMAQGLQEKRREVCQGTLYRRESQGPPNGLYRTWNLKEPQTEHPSYLLSEEQSILARSRI